jgi:hypothetical protein
VNPHRAPNLRRRRDVVQQSKDLPPCAVYEAEHLGLKEVSNREDETSSKLSVRHRPQRPDRNVCVRF